MSRRKAPQNGEMTQICDLVNGGDSNDTMTLYAKTDRTTPIHIKKNSKISMFFDFDTQNTVHHGTIGANDFMYILPPQQGSEFGITVDGETYSISAANMRIDF